MVSLGVLFVVCCAAAAVHASRRGSGGEAATRAIAMVVTPDQIVLPLDAYLDTGRGSLTVSKALALLTDDCLRRHGLHALPPASVAGRSRLALNERRYGLLNPDQAKAFGYHLTRPAPSAKADAVRPTADQLDFAYGTGGNVIAGQRVPAGGCYGEASRSLNGDARAVDFDIPKILSLETFQRSRQDARVGKAFETWSACMRRSGFSYPDPFTAASTFKADKATEQEIRVGTADVACNRETNLAGVWLAVESELQRSALSQHPAEFAAIKHLLDLRHRNAVKALRAHNIAEPTG
jgi:hypothetical protein